MFNHWDRLLRLSSNLSLEDFHFKTGTDEILASIYHPLNERDNKDNTKCRNTIICHIELALCFASQKESQLTHVATSGRQLRGEEEEDSSQKNVRQRDLRF